MLSRRRLLIRRLLVFVWFLLITWLLFFQMKIYAQDAATGAIRGTVLDESGARIRLARVIVTEQATGLRRGTMTDDDGVFQARLLTPGPYAIKVEAQGMAPIEAVNLTVQVGGELQVKLTLRVEIQTESVTVSAESPQVQTRSSENAQVIDEKAIQELPLNGRRFSDLALLVPGVVQDPRGLTSSANGDLSSGGVRGYQSSYLVDGGDNNNSFFAQARGRYRAHYQFSNEVIQEFRVNTNNYAAELGRAGAAVINVVTKSGSNDFHGKAFYFLRDSRFGAQNPYLDFKPVDHQQQFGTTLGGPLHKNRAFFYAGYDQHIFHVPTVVRFANGADVIVPQPSDYEETDQALVFLAARSLDGMAGNFRSSMVGGAGFGKLDVVLSSTNLLSARLSTSSYDGDNNVYFDPGSPITNYAMSENGTETVSTLTGSGSLTSGISRRVTNNLRVQSSRDLQDSTPNAEWARTQVQGILEGFGRSLILPRQTHEGKLHLTESMNLDLRRHAWKVGADMVRTQIYNYFPLQFGGGYVFSHIRVNPFTFAPETYGMEITPLRAYAHLVPRYYMQNFGTSETHPDTNEYSLFAQDSIRLTDNLGVTVGLRYDLQKFRTNRLVSNPLWPLSGQVPYDTNNFAPRFGFAYSAGDEHPLIVRGGYGIFYTRIPSIYNSQVEIDNGINRNHLFLDNADYYDHQVFPEYPNAAAACDPGAKSCDAPASVIGNLTSEVSSFGPNFQIPFVQQASVGVEKEVVDRFYVDASYVYTHGEHLIRARDVNLPSPTRVSYPIFDETGTNFLGSYYEVDSFTDWVTTATLACPFPPCTGDLQRPISQLGAINVFESTASSIYHGFTISAKQRMSHGLAFRVAYTWGQAIDDGQDALVVGRAATVQNPYSPQSEKSWSSVDQRNRLVGSWTYEPKLPHATGSVLKLLFDDWRFTGLMTYGSGRPVSARIIGDANRDGNMSNDRLPGYSRNAFLGPNYMTADLRLARRFRFGGRLSLELMAEAFNAFNRDNKRLDITDDGFSNSAADFVNYDSVINAHHYPAQYRILNGFLTPNNSYAPRQLQFAIRFYY